MDFLSPGFLLLLELIPVLIGVYVWVLHRRRRFAVRFSSLSLVREALPKQSFLRRHLPFILFLTALASLAVAAARPVRVISIPTDQTTIIMAIDVSGSMRSQDIYPNRLLAAENAALSFVQSQKAKTQIGIVAFSSFAEEIQPPTTDQSALQGAIESLTVGRFTAIGSGILKSIDSISEVDKSVAPSVTDTSPGVEPTPVPKGAYAPDIIVLLTDGVSNTGPMPLDAAQQAVDRGIRVYTIGFGTVNGYLPGTGRQQGNDPFGGGGFGRGFRMGVDENTLKQIADMTGGQFYTASSAGELQNVFQSLPTYLITKHETQEISFLFAALGALLAGMAVTLSLIWHPLP